MMSRPVSHVERTTDFTGDALAFLARLSHVGLDNGLVRQLLKLKLPVEECLGSFSTIRGDSNAFI